MRLRDLFSLLKDTYTEFNEDKAPRLGAALAYYTLFSLAPFLVIVIAIAGLVFGAEAARGQIVGAIGGLVGQQGAEAIETMIEGASNPASGILATIIGFATLFLGASGVLGELQESLNTIWEVTRKPGGGILGIIKARFFSFTLVIGTGFLLLVSLVVTAALQVFGEYLATFVPGGDLFLQILNFVISLGLTTVLFAVLYKVVPDADIAWRDVWIGALVTAVLFSIGRILIGFYLGRGATASVYGAAGSLVIVILWVYYSAQILFFGAEFTQVYANRFGSRVRPAEGAVPTTERARLEQGMPRHKDVAGATQTNQAVETVAHEREAAGQHENPHRARAKDGASDAKQRHPAREDDASVSPRPPQRPGLARSVAGLAIYGVLKALGARDKEHTAPS